MSEGLPLVIMRVRRSARVSVQIKLTVFKGQPILEVRNYWREKDGSWRATRKGLSLGVKHIPALADALAQAETIARSMGLLPNNDGG